MQHMNNTSLKEQQSLLSKEEKKSLLCFIVKMFVPIVIFLFLFYILYTSQID